MPIRIQLSRTKGWRMPPNTVKVDRTTRYGNPFKDSEHSFNGDAKVRLANGMDLLIDDWWTAQTAVALFYQWITGQPVLDPSRHPDDAAPLTACKLPAPPDLAPLRGKNLACWCKPGAFCHADLLLELANAEPSA